MRKTANYNTLIIVKKFSLLVLFLLLIHHTNYAQFIGDSVLAKEEWWQFSVPEKGIYKLTGKDLQSMLGVNLSNINAKNIRVFKNDEGIRPQSNSISRVDDLKETAITVSASGEQFLESDYILVYVRGTEQVIYDENKKTITTYKNVYASFSYIYLNLFSANKGKRIVSTPSYNNFTKEYSTFDTYSVLENDDYKILNSGRKWYSNPIKENKVFSIPLPAQIKKGNVNVTIDAMSGQNFASNTQLSFYFQSSKIGEIDFLKLPKNFATYSNVGTEKSSSWTITSPSNITNSFDLECKFLSDVKDGSRGYIDRMVLNYKSNYMFTDKPYIFSQVYESKNNESVKIAFLNNKQESHYVWDITDAYTPKEMVLIQETGKNPYFNYKTNNNIHQFVTLNKKVLPTPSFVQKINNQNLHGQQAVDMLILCPKGFISLGEQWKSWRTSHSNLSVSVVSVESIYHEFSGGQQDVSGIRDFIRMVYLKGKKKNSPLRYVLLLGDGSYDYLDKIEGNTNRVPIYESRNSLDPLKSYGSDDFYGFMDDNEGEWEENDFNSATIDVAIGRIPINTLEEGQAVLKKIQYYETSPDTIGTWRNKITLTADDEDNGIHMKDGLLMESIIKNNGGDDFDVHKIFLDDYQQIPIGGKETSADFQQVVHKTLEEGTLIFNYAGHGREDLLAEENMIDLDYIHGMTNINKLAFFVTATCEFSRIDDPKYFYEKSGGEAALLNPNGGAVALFSTGRPVFAYSNRKLNAAFYTYLLKKNNGEYRPIGDIFKDTKNNSISGVINRNFILLGDPSLILNFPKNTVSLNLVENGSNTKQGTLSPSTKSLLHGEVFNPSMVLMTGFNGKVEVTIFDHPQQQKTLGFQQESISYNSFSSIIYKGITTVTNGKFSLSFYTPNTIDLGNQNSFKILTYAYDINNNQDANGNGLNIKITSSKNQNETTDTTPPQITVSKQIIDNQYYIDVLLHDESGIDLTNNNNGSGVTLSINDNKITSITKYYNPLDVTRGKIRYRVGILDKGAYIIRINAKDVFGNARDITTKIIEGDKNNNLISNTNVYPTLLDHSNNDKLNFVIQHKGYSHEMGLTIQIYTMQGELIENKYLNFSDSNGYIENISWQPIHVYKPGIYIYKLILKDMNTNNSDTEVGKIIIK